MFSTEVVLKSVLENYFIEPIQVEVKYSTFKIISVRFCFSTLWSLHILSKAFESGLEDAHKMLKILKKLNMFLVSQPSRFHMEMLTETVIRNVQTIRNNLSFFTKASKVTWVIIGGKVCSHKSISRVHWFIIKDTVCSYQPLSSWMILPLFPPSIDSISIPVVKKEVRTEKHRKVEPDVFIAVKGGNIESVRFQEKLHVW